MEALRFPVWEKPFREAQSEIDLDKLVEKIHETEAAMFVRWQELASSRDSRVELDAMDRACQDLLMIRVEKLRWPIAKFDSSSGS